MEDEEHIETDESGEHVTHMPSTIDEESPDTVPEEAIEEE